MKKIIFGLLGLSVLFISVPVQADTLYFAAQAGFSTLPSSDNNDPNNPGNSFELNTQNGINGALAVGASFGMLRAEVEGVYRYNPTDKIVGTGGPQGADGNFNTVHIFLNGYLDFNLLGIVTPYAGVGVGYGTVSLNLKQLDGTQLVDDEDNIYSYQLIAGAALNITDNFSLTGEYRYFDTITDVKWTLSGLNNFVESSDIRSHEIRFGIRYWFF